MEIVVRDLEYTELPKNGDWIEVMGRKNWYILMEIENSYTSAGWTMKLRKVRWYDYFFRWIKKLLQLWISRLMLSFL